MVCYHSEQNLLQMQSNEIPFSPNAAWTGSWTELYNAPPVWKVGEVMWFDKDYGNQWQNSGEIHQ